MFLLDSKNSIIADFLLGKQYEYGFFGLHFCNEGQLTTLKNIMLYVLVCFLYLFTILECCY